MSHSDSDDELALSAATLAALQEFRQEETQRQEEFAKLASAAERDFESSKHKGIHLFKEDWQLSQFWYSDETADTLADALLEGADENTVIAIVSAPSVYAAIKKRDEKTLPTTQIYLFEFDKRFEVLAGSDHFVFYDFADPTNFSDKLKGKVHRLLIDPPFLNENCQTKSSITAKSLLVSDKSVKTKDNDLQYRLISCTGERMADVIKKVYPDTHITSFFPEHGNGLSNEFRCYASFEWSKWKFAN
ncbi:Protein-lysine N-methyltransferase efm5 [Hanseniaspora vineae]